MNYKAAIKRPFGDFKKLTIGALMFMIPFVNVITSFIAVGYSLECGRNFKKLPEWKNFKNYFVRGLLSAVISFIYYSVLVLIPLTIMASYFSTDFKDLEITFAENATIFISMLPLLLLVMLIAPMAILHYIQKYNFKSGFKIKSVFKKTFTLVYLKAWVIALLYSIALGVILFFLSALLGFTIVVPIVLSGYQAIMVSVTMFTLLGQAYKKIG